jgi:endonuclease/exonuclease/phosphatase family metal-dependent hydrolase
MVRDAIVEQGPDFVGIQEALPHQARYLARELPHLGHHSGRPRFARPCWLPLLNETVPILYDSARWRIDETEGGTFWLSTDPDQPGSKGFGNFLVPRIVTWARFHDKSNDDDKNEEQQRSSSVYVFNTHFAHDDAASNCGRRSAELLVKRIAERRHLDDPVIVTGDFNCTEEGDAIRYLTGNNNNADNDNDGSRPPVRLVDTYRHTHAANYNNNNNNSNNSVVQSSAGTFHGWTGRRDGPRIDYVFVDEGTRILDAEILCTSTAGKGSSRRRIFPSDHYPVIAHIETRTGEKNQNK